jgi:hypothetical protein
LVFSWENAACCRAGGIMSAPGRLSAAFDFVCIKQHGKHWPDEDDSETASSLGASRNLEPSKFNYSESISGWIGR